MQPNSKKIDKNLKLEKNKLKINKPQNSLISIFLAVSV